MTLKALAVASTLLFAATILGQEPPPPKDKGKPEVIRKLSKRERKAAIDKLEPRHQEFTADVEPIILPAELDMFLMLTSDAERDSWVEEFWRRRDHMNRTSGVFKEAYYQRLTTARDLFKRIDNDRARMYLLHGPPADVIKSNCGRILQPTEVWKYGQIPGMGYDMRLLFYRPRGNGEYRLWNPNGGAIALAELLVAPDSIESRTAEEARRREQAISNSPYAAISRVQLECTEGAEIMFAITQMIQNRVDLMKLFAPPELNPEAVQKMLRSVVIANPNAPKLSADFSVRFPTKEGSRTDVQMMLLVPRGELSPAEVGGTEVYTVDVTGEVLKDGQLWEKYRYRFDFPGDVQAEQLPIVIDRLLRPNDYVSRIKITDANTGAEAVVETPITVPEVFLPETSGAGGFSPPALATTAATGEPPSHPGGLKPTAPQGVATAQDVAEVLPPELRIIPPSDEIVSGMTTIETLITGDAIKAVEFSLDGRKIAVRRSPPYALDFDFGAVPQMRRIRAVALDKQNKPITGDELTINAGTDPFRIRILSPRVAPRLSGLTRVELDVSVPDGDELAAVELYWNETRLAVLYDGPFVQTIDVPKFDGPAYLRAVATLKDKTAPPVEDVVMINTPAHMEELNVHLIELPTTVILNGKPTDKLTASSFKVLDEGQPVSIAKFEYVRNLPLSIGLAIDSSGSMIQRMNEAQKAGAQFFEKVMRKGDKAFLVAFAKEPQMMQKWSTKVTDVHAGLAKLRAEETTALYDAIIYALYNFHGVRGQKALVLISDGRDTASKFTYEQALEYARRTGVPIYGIGIGIRPGDNDVRFKLDQLCRNTGGSTYYIEQARDLQRVYDDIQTELRSQYILGFYPSPDIKPGSKWREVTVQASEGKVKTVKGYFP